MSLGESYQAENCQLDEHSAPVVLLDPHQFVAFARLCLTTVFILEGSIGAQTVRLSGGSCQVLDQLLLGVHARCLSLLRRPRDPTRSRLVLAPGTTDSSWASGARTRTGCIRYPAESIQIALLLEAQDPQELFFWGEAETVRCFGCLETGCPVTWRIRYQETWRSAVWAVNLGTVAYGVTRKHGGKRTRSVWRVQEYAGTPCQA